MANYCEQCGSELGFDAQYCGECGEPVDGFALGGPGLRLQCRRQPHHQPQASRCLQM